MNEMIHIGNYEQFAIDYIDGKLSGDLLDAFRAFLIQHPEIEMEIGALLDSEIAVRPTVDNVTDRDALKKRIVPVHPIDEDNYEAFFALSVGHGIQDADEAKALQQFLNANDFLKPDFKRFQATRLLPDQSINFKAKSALRQPVPIGEYVRAVPVAYYRIAAAVVIGAGLWAAYFTGEPVYRVRTATPQFAHMENTPEEVQSQPSQGSPTTETIAVFAHDQNTMLTVETRERAATMPRMDRVPALAYNLSLDHDITERKDDGVQVATAAVNTRRATELTLVQYLGQRMLRLSPDQSSDRNTLLRKSLEQAANRTDWLAVKDQQGSERNTLQLIAGNFEFRRVNYNH